MIQAIPFAVILVGAILPIGVVSYGSTQLLKKYYSKIKPYSPIVSLVIGVLLGILPGVTRELLSLAKGTPVDHLSLGTRFIIGASGGFLGPSVYTWIHKVLVRLGSSK